MTEPSNGKLQDVTRSTPDVSHWPPVESLFTELQPSTLTAVAMPIKGLYKKLIIMIK